MPKLLNRIGLARICCVAWLSVTAQAAEVRLSGVDGAAAENIRNTVDLIRVEDESLPRWQLDWLRRTAPDQVAEALKPFGYYQPSVNIEVVSSETPPVYQIDIDPGEPVRVRDLRLTAPADVSKQTPFAEWLENWPLAVDAILDQRAYAEAKAALERAAEAHGYFRFQWTQQRILISEDRLHADIELAFNAGQQAVFGELTLQRDDFAPRVMQRFIEIHAGDAYSQDLIDQLREDLSASGYYRNVSVREIIHRDRSPPVVDLATELELRPPNTYSATLGFGTDTGPRIQLGWQRHYLSSRGDSLDVGFGAQQANTEFVLRADYRLPRGNDAGEFWFADVTGLREEEDFRFIQTGLDEEVFPALNGSQRQTQWNVGLLNQRNRNSAWPLQERWFVSYVFDRFDALDRDQLDPEQQALLNNNPQLVDSLETEQSVVAVGASWDLRHIIGSGFGIEGTRAQLRLAGATSGFASDVSFAQVYLGVRHSQIFGERHKILLRGEIGYTAVETNDFTVSLDDRSLDLSITRLPERYRFKAGGDRSVRGYGFENLGNNRIGSNHLVTLSAEYEYRLSTDWSVAAFYDAGNAFNRFSNLKLVRGVGLGVRWYTALGPVRLDFAQALNEPGEGLRLHLTIGSPLL
ncbi:MAG: autotransporter assembly complex family protein [Wenzhouxiangellaceae bacterium]